MFTAGVQGNLSSLHQPKLEPVKDQNRLTQLFLNAAVAPPKPTSRPSSEHKQPITQNQEQARIEALRNLKAASSKYNLADLNSAQNHAEKSVDQKAALQEYYQQLSNAAEKLAGELGINVTRVRLSDPTHELPDVQLVTPATPKDLDKLRFEYDAVKKYIAEQIGSVGNPFGEMTNLASDDLQLYSDSIAVYRSFYRLVNKLADAVKAKACFGPDDDLQIIKGEASLIRKIQTDTVARVREIFNARADLPSPAVYEDYISQASQETIKNLADVIRGTIIVDSIEQMRQLIAHINYLSLASVYIRGIKYKNIFAEPVSRPDGYASVHVKLLLAYQDDKGQMRSMITEIQLQFSLLFNGKKQCPKEYMHLIMEYLRKQRSGQLAGADYNQESAEAASMLQALLVMKMLKQATPPRKANASEMVSTRNPFKHVMTFLTPDDCATFSLTSRNMRLLVIAAKMMPEQIPLASMTPNAFQPANFDQNNSCTVYVDRSPKGQELTAGSFFCSLSGVSGGGYLGYLMGSALADSISPWLIDPAGWEQGPVEC